MNTAAAFVTPRPSSRTEKILAIKQARDEGIKTLACDYYVWKALSDLGPNLTSTWRHALEFAANRLQRGSNEERARVEALLRLAIETYDSLVDDLFGEHGC